MSIDLTPKRIGRASWSTLLYWRYRRLLHGQKKYGDGHKRRNGPIDVLEELLDAQNILSLHQGRYREEGAATWAVRLACAMIHASLWVTIFFVRILSLILPDSMLEDAPDEQRI